jgi:hypothetical protein
MVYFLFADCRVVAITIIVVTMMMFVIVISMIMVTSLASLMSNTIVIMNTSPPYDNDILMHAQVVITFSLIGWMGKLSDIFVTLFYCRTCTQIILTIMHMMKLGSNYELV